MAEQVTVTRDKETTRTVKFAGRTADADFTIYVQKSSPRAQAESFTVTVEDAG